MRTYKLFLGAAELAAALVAPAAAENPPTLAEISKQLKDIDAGFRVMSEAVKADVTAIKSDLAELRSHLESMRREVEVLRQGLKTEQVRGQKCDAEVADLKLRLDQLRTQCKQETESLRRAFSYQPGAAGPLGTTGPAAPNGGSDTTMLPPTPAPPPPPAMGTVFLRNLSDVNATFIVNGQPYAVLAGRTMEVRNIPAGTFTYQIQAEGFGVIHPFASRYLPAGGSYTLNIDPRPVAVVCP
jgi:hypothetical protein